MRWVGLINTIKAQVGEVIFVELIIIDKKIFLIPIDFNVTL